mmetsp:Transcript_21771/g.61971  ORF Transcript_21771/g.61971 Transcript_21771/m.61971 type:complete len:191 (-) Transcript_21771:45-617(-)|eukprot:CAMPEP_0119569168 /NCGR_PEP_ID=MMETSP1352-20130426/40908_1 /TAXON_ID=265584 /ORGANISM="Stauroneis constricta, Strain CCMP1120" /LENGTH=190 /DNA_ID=CAMNT_0007618681 /DNA_START=77 /DNA_END=649 /DNA_ORIENTATION=+
MKFSTAGTSSASALLLMALICCTMMIDEASAFARGSIQSSYRQGGRQTLIGNNIRSQPMELHAAADADAGGAKKKKAKTKKAAKKKKAAAKKAAATVETFNKADFVQSVVEKTGLTKADAERSLNAVLETITENVADGKKISLIGFGSFASKYRAARKGRNPQTGEELDIAASYAPGFTASKKFKEMCNE